MTANCWVLKILSGVHIGAELRLTKASYTLGRSADSDIVIHDSTLSEHCLTIHCGEKITLEKSDAEIAWYHAGAPVADTGLEIIPYQVLTVGSLHCCFGREGERWPSIHIPTIIAPECADEPIAIAESGGLQARVRGKNRAKIPGRQTTANKRVWLNISSGVFLLLCGFVFNTGSNSGEAHIDNASNKNYRATENPTDYKSPSVDRLQNIIANEWQLRDLSVVETSRNNKSLFQISGYVSDKIEQRRLVRQLDKMDIEYRLNIKPMDRLVSAATNIVRRNLGEQVRVETSTKAGYLNISGSCPDGQLWEKTKAQIQMDVPGILGIEDNIVLPADKVKLVINWADELGIDSTLDIQTYRDKLLVKSNGDLAESIAWKEVESKYMERFGETDTLVLVAHQNPNLAIQGVNYGRTPYVIMRDGKKYIEGAQLQNGFSIDKIARDSIVLTKSGKTIEYRIRK